MQPQVRQHKERAEMLHTFVNMEQFCPLPFAQTRAASSLAALCESLVNLPHTALHCVKEREHLLRYGTLLLSPSAGAVCAAYRQHRHSCIMVQVCLLYEQDCFCAGMDVFLHKNNPSREIMSRRKCFFSPRYAILWEAYRFHAIPGF